MLLTFLAIWLVSAIIFLVAWHRLFKFCEINLSDEEIKIIDDAIEADK